MSDRLITSVVSRSLSPNIVMLGFVSLFTAMSSATVYSLFLYSWSQFSEQASQSLD